MNKTFFKIETYVTTHITFIHINMYRLYFVLQTNIKITNYELNMLWQYYLNEEKREQRLYDH